MANDSADGKGVDLPHGAYSRIARRMRPQVTAQHVREVALGNRRSERVEAAIARYVASLKQTAGVAA